ncbi:MAG: 50S ribosomal protein L18 [Candidatus Nealsonbacteria bacterium CG_4_9_14_0_2_um_filter_37_38]|uniref:Large ribosomal subunit protein uL18 n=1 Tax=Candidatus Nealsonbacteria bacterium CG_4_10_14_0_8_um_filter_37_14 TaxID=1974684 RepID=A0A2M7R6W7_9BACT|nr:MAG: 50S ribosomal protein L18 [Candidatus Nealsonbacteria bacterium CG11_big_fil_rev_8_21_14_0_20_37_68]PIW91994.1 MAG: 50S ribosomal protein L18 [Candidatus Nealsonbacteria bacterium CG_4_8_14_3_um_filter_37_23]PIY88981.1 MAG: 50S ribosomal protein L18 [Candidatus Nealsonbacteria bacterium CG_4_10_14_0_8_um_filter_37_14]PJC51643.1 MAG: 50S ribosomal protein L18 [Candidatus Nealsonbacteria bacterium CG_4_9_14_0_2_um_filter_37_38]
MLEKQQKRYRRHKRVRAKIKDTSKVPRLCVFRSTKHIYAQLIDDEKGQTILSSNDLGFKKLKTQIRPAAAKAAASKQKLKVREKKEQIIRIGKVAIAYEVGKLIAERALKKKIERVVFDRGGYRYHGRVKALVEGAREGGLQF